MHFGRRRMCTPLLSIPHNLPSSGEIKEESLTEYRNGGFNIAKRALPLLLRAKDAVPYPPTLIFTGATASLKGSANFASFASAKFALRALAQSLAREFGPQGVHVSHAVIDGVIDIPRTKSWDLGHEDAKLSPDAVSLRDPVFSGRV